MKSVPIQFQPQASRVGALLLAAVVLTTIAWDRLPAQSPRQPDGVERRTALDAGVRPLPRIQSIPIEPRAYAGTLAAAAMPLAPIEKSRTAEPIGPGRLDPLAGTTLEEISQLALGNSPAIREAETHALAARQRAYQASLYPNPTVGTASPQLAGNQTQYNVYVIQDWVTKGKIPLNVAAAELAALQAELAAIRARFDVLTTLRQRFYAALAAQRRAEVLEDMVAIARRAKETSEAILANDLGAKADVLQLGIELSRAEVELVNAITLSETSKRQLAASAGLIDMQIARVRGDLQEKLPYQEVRLIQQDVLARHALVRSAEQEIVRSRILLRRAEVEPIPNVNFMGGYQNQQPGAFAPQNQAIYQVQIVVPLFNRNQGNIRAAQAGIGTAMAQLTRVRTELANATAAAVGRYVTALQLADRYEKEILPNAIDLQRISATTYREGHVDFIRYLVAQRELLSANLAHINALEARWMAAAEIAGLLQSDQFP